MGKPTCKADMENLKQQQWTKKWKDLKVTFPYKTRVGSCCSSEQPCQPSEQPSQPSEQPFQPSENRVHPSSFLKNTSFSVRYKQHMVTNWLNHWIQYIIWCHVSNKKIWEAKYKEKIWLLWRKVLWWLRRILLQFTQCVNTLCFPVTIGSSSLGSLFKLTDVLSGPNFSDNRNTHSLREKPFVWLSSYMI